jgi:hypothetical protein
MTAPTRQELLRRPPRRFRNGRNRSKADIFIWEEAGARLAIKDYSPRPAWIRASLGRVLVRRECRAYQRLGERRGIPRFAGQVDAYAFATAFVEGPDLSRLRPGEVSASFFDQLLALLEEIHAAGVAQGDLHHRDVLVGADGRPFLVDFSTAVFSDPGAGSIRRWLFQAACGADRRAALKLKRRHVPGALTESEAAELTRLPPWYRFGKFIRRRLLSRPGR